MCNNLSDVAVAHTRNPPRQTKKPTGSIFHRMAAAKAPAASKHALLWEFFVAATPADALAAVTAAVAADPAALCGGWVAHALGHPALLRAVLCNRDAIARHYTELAFVRDADAVEVALGLLHAVFHTRSREASVGSDAGAAAGAQPSPATPTSAAAAADADANLFAARVR
jgi:hypothetical protein